MRMKFLEMRYPVWTRLIQDFLLGLWIKKEELAKVGVKIDDKDYLSTIISSLPHALLNFASAQLASACMFSMSKSIDSDVLISLLIEEADCQKAQHAQRQGFSEKKRRMRRMKLWLQQLELQKEKVERVVTRKMSPAGVAVRKGILKTSVQIYQNPRMERMTHPTRNLSPALQMLLNWTRTWKLKGLGLYGTQIWMTTIRMMIPQIWLMILIQPECLTMIQTGFLRSLKEIVRQMMKTDLLMVLMNLRRPSKLQMGLSPIQRVLNSNSSTPIAFNTYFPITINLKTFTIFHQNLSVLQTSKVSVL